MQVYGVSLDCPDSHQRFQEKHSPTFPLLTDEGGATTTALGVLSDRRLANRVTFLLDSAGQAVKAYPDVSPETHADEILEVAKTS
jgi:peroxiredoxin Q/BCP